MSKFKYLVLTFGLIFGIGLIMPSIANATSVVSDICAADQDSALCTSSKNTSLMTYVVSITNTMLFVLGALAVIMIIYGGITYTISAGDAKKVEKAKSTILYAVVGLVVALLAGAIVNYVLGVFK